jgi:hypothetical protein
MIAVTPQSSVGPSELEADLPGKPVASFGKSRCVAAFCASVSTRNAKMPRPVALDGQP